MIPIIKPWFGEEEVAAARDVIESGWVAQGPRVAEFERVLAGRVGARHGVAVSSCTAGLHLALHVLGVGPGDEVVVPSLSFIASANAPRYVGAKPVFADVDSATFNLTPETIGAVLTPSTKAVILVHQVGMPADVEAVHELCDPLGVAVVEDAACAIGSTYRGRFIGGHSELVTFSFHPRKLVTTGEGGMVMTSSDELAERLARLRQHGMSVGAFDRHEADRPILEEYVETGFNYRMTDVQAAIGIVQLSRLNEIVSRRRALAERYAELLADMPRVALPTDPSYGTTNHQSYVVVLADDFPLARNEVLRRLMDAGIAARRGVMAAHREPAFAGHPHGALPVTESLTDNSLLLPLYHSMTPGEQDRVVEGMRKTAWS